MNNAAQSDPAERSAIMRLFYRNWRRLGLAGGSTGFGWVKNVEAAHGNAVIRQGRRRRVHLVSVPPEQRAAVLREYVRIASSGRQHFPLPVGALLSDFEAIAGRYPVYRIDAA
jgi:hypothetical protein